MRTAVEAGRRLKLNKAWTRPRGAAGGPTGALFVMPNITVPNARWLNAVS
ncbi:hypothetical protein GCM10027048_02770 [Hymenobacter coalescens]